MASFSPHIAPESLENVLNSLETLLDHDQQVPRHTLFNSHAPQYAVREPFSNQPAEQYDDPLILEEIVTNPAYTVSPRKIPVLKNVVRPVRDIHLAASTNKLDVENTLNELRAELADIVTNVMLDAREHLKDHDADHQDVMKTSLKNFLDDLSNQLPR